jgi:hypothetical protein
MRPALKSLAITCAATAAELLIAKIIPALAAGLIAAAIELHPERAMEEAKRRNAR